MIWKSVRYRGTVATVMTEEFRTKRSLPRLLELLESPTDDKDKKLGGRLPIRALSFEPPRNFPRDFDSEQWMAEEFTTLVEILDTFSEHHNRHDDTDNRLKILFIEGDAAELPMDVARNLINSVVNIDSLQVLRLNSLYFSDAGWLGTLSDIPRLDNIQTLQIMHGSVRLPELLNFAPNVESLLAWTHDRAFWTLKDEILSRLPQLTKLSLDAVHHPSMLQNLAEAIEKIHHDQNSTIPLEELFLEGHQPNNQRSRLIQALGKTAPNLKRLSLYHVKNPKSAFAHEIADHLPHLESLALVAGDCSAPTLWSDELEYYLEALARFQQLTFFAWDRLPPRFISDQTISVAQINYDCFKQMGLSLTNIREIVNIVQDVSEGSTGWFATFKPVEASSTSTSATNKVQLTVRHETRKDFLVGLDHFVVLRDKQRNNLSIV
ncbi:hypothetical protein OIO90_000575 [Microbotryomycetes sp. JL221]|nr:hypothetical protein OIO90_000575 [Microbotryomycetes sp. JL221]